MATTHTHQYKRQPKIAHNDISHDSSIADGVSSGHEGVLEHTFPSTRTYTPSVTLPQGGHLSFSQTGVEHYPHTHLHQADEQSGPDLHKLPRYSSLPYLGPTNGLELSDNLKSPSTLQHPHAFQWHLSKTGPQSPLPGLYSRRLSDEKVLNTPAFVPSFIAQEAPPCPQDKVDIVTKSPDNIQSSILRFEHSITLNLANQFNENDLSPDVKESFAKLSPALRNIRAQKWSGIMVEVLNDIHHNISIHDFYNLLYNPRPAFECIRNTAEAPESLERKLNALKVFHLVLITFQNPGVTAGLLWNVPPQNLRISVTKFYEVLRTSLAAKIIFALLKKVDSSLMGYHRVSRVTAYKFYYIICQKLIQKCPGVSNYPGFRETLTLGQLRLGKITSLVYPNIITRKIGRRGDSKAHYMGLTVNYSILDEESLDLVDLEIPQLMDHFNDKRGLRISKSKNPQDEDEDLTESYSSTKPASTHAVTSSEKPLHCYIQSWSAYADAKI
ncbi:hypothetical protein JCM33374_g1281 [Metschnikowia sp. JCM 33374]|nr:hypothetical protein JCM33374_g1281 [Metschnikowia sp. JCM 33374]